MFSHANRLKILCTIILIALMYSVVCVLGPDKKDLPEPRADPRPYLGTWRNTDVVESTDWTYGYISERIYQLFPDNTYIAGMEYIPHVANLAAPDSIKMLIREKRYAAITWEGTYNEREEDLLQFRIDYVQYIAGQWKVQSHIKYTVQWEIERPGVLLMYHMQEVFQFPNRPVEFLQMLGGESSDLLKVMKRVQKRSLGGG